LIPSTIPNTDAISYIEKTYEEYFVSISEIFPRESRLVLLRQLVQHYLSAYEEVAISELNYGNEEIGLKIGYYVDPIVKDELQSAIEIFQRLHGPGSNHAKFLREKLKLVGNHIGSAHKKYQPFNEISSVYLNGIEQVYKEILGWALPSEGQEILGDVTFFSEKGRKKEMPTLKSVTIENFQGVFGNVNKSTVNQNLGIIINKNDFESLSKCLEGHGVDVKDLEELKMAIETDPAPANSGTFGNKVSAWVGKMMGKASDGTWSISIAAAGNLLSTAISKYYGI